MDFITILIVVLMIAALIMEHFTIKSESYQLPVDDDDDRTYEVEFSDKSKLIVYTVATKKPPDVLKKKFMESEVIQKIAQTQETYKTRSIYPKQVRYSSLHGLTGVAKDAYTWTNTTTKELYHSPVAIPKAILGGYVLYKFWPVMIAFKYANNDGKAYAASIRNNKKARSEADTCEVIDYGTSVAIRSNSPVVNVKMLE